MKKFYEFLRSPGLCRYKVFAAALGIMLTSGIALYAVPVVQQPRERIDISMKDATLEQVLLYVQNTSGYYVLFNSTEIKGVTGLNIDLRNATVAEVLRTALSNTKLSYTIEDDTIVVKGGRQAQNVTPATRQDPRLTISGTVRQAAGKQPLAGVTILVEGTNIGTTTDARGQFSLTLAQRGNVMLVVRYIGMETRRIPYTGQASLNIELSESVQSVGAVVVTGYADINVDKTASNVTVIRGGDLAKVSPTSVMAGISAFEPSFRLKENLAAGANPNVLPEFSIRGETALSPDILSEAQSTVSRQSLLSNRNLPIFLVDGFEVDVERIYDMDPNRIETLSILKDASATALYGSRAANGIIVIETKAPRSGRVNVDYNITTTLHAPDLRSYDLMNAHEKLQAEIDGGYYPYNLDEQATTNLRNLLNYFLKLSNANRGVDTDWIARGVRNVVNHRHDINVYGGESNTRWNANVNYNSGNGVMKGSKRNTYSAELQLHITLGNFILTNKARYGGQKGSESPFGSFSSYSHKHPYDMVKDEFTGEFVHILPIWEASSLPESQRVNPEFEAANYNSFTKNKYDDYSDQIQLRWDVSPRFHITGSYFIDKKYSENSKFIDPRSKFFEHTVELNELGELTLTQREVLSMEGRLQFSYNNQFGKHFIAVNTNGTLGQDKASQTSYHYKGFASGHVPTPNAAASIASKPSNRNQLQRKVSVNFYGNYSYDEIYLVDLAFAVDGNSEFGSRHKAAPFWSAAGAVQLHNYEFFRSEIIDRLRIRASYGLLGRVPSTQSATMNIYQNISLDDWYISGVGAILSAMGNPGLQWEKTYLTDLSAEIQMWQNRFYLKGGYYNKISSGQLTEVGIPSSSGFTYYWDNLGKVKNEGFEVDFHVEPLRTQDWSLRIGAKLRHNKNVITELSDALKAYNLLVDDFFAGYPKNSTTKKDMGYGVPYRKFFEGQSTTTIAAVRSLGINPGNGQELYMRPDGTLTYIWSSADQIMAGDTEPTMTGTINVSMRWKQFDLLASLYFEYGAQAYNSTLMRYVENVDLKLQNADKRVNTMRWKQPGDLAPLKSIADRAFITRPTTRFVQDNNIFRSTSLDVGYTLKHELIRRVGLSNVRFSFNTGELFYLSSMKRERGTDYPYERTYAFKAQISF